MAKHTVTFHGPNGKPGKAKEPKTLIVRYHQTRVEYPIKKNASSVEIEVPDGVEFVLQIDEARNFFKAGGMFMEKRQFPGGATQLFGIDAGNDIVGGEEDDTEEEQADASTTSNDSNEGGETSAPTPAKQTKQSISEPKG